MTVDTRTSLLDLLREHLDLTGAKKGCDHGQCGACTILIDGRRANACLALAVAHDGAEITTVEGLADGDELHPLQQAFIEHDAFQCGYCTPGSCAPRPGCWPRPGGLAERGHAAGRGTCERRDRADRGRDQGANERQPVPLRRLREHRPRDRGRVLVRPFRYERAGDADRAVALLAAEPEARFLGGGTNLVDLMRLGVETPAMLIDVNHLGHGRIEDTDGGGLRIGAARQQQRPGCRSARARALPGAILGGAAWRVRAASQSRHGRREPAPANALPLLPGRHQAVQQARGSGGGRIRVVAPRARATIATSRSSGIRSCAWPPTHRTWRSRWPRSRRPFTCRGRVGEPHDPDPRLSPPPG